MKRTSSDGRRSQSATARMTPERVRVELIVEYVGADMGVDNFVSLVLVEHN